MKKDNNKKRKKLSDKMKLQGKSKKIWDFLWHEDSLASWLINIALAFLLVKFIIYPLLGLLFGTSLPIVAVVSGSMDHDASFDDWWTKQEDFYLSPDRKVPITKQQFELFPLKSGFSKGDVIILGKANTENIKLGDIIVFQSSKNYPIIHRVIAIHDGYYETKGDGLYSQHTPANSVVNELEIYPEQILGKASFKIPWLGWIKIGFSCGWDSITGSSRIPGGNGFKGCLLADM